MAIQHLKNEIKFLESLEEKGILNNASKVKLFWFRNALVYVEKDELADPLNCEWYCAHDSGRTLVKCSNCDGDADNCAFRWTKEEILKLR